METIEVHSKDFVIRWLEVDSVSRVTWKLVPLKRSINFGVFSHNEEKSGRSLSEATGSLSERLDTSGFKSVTEGGLSRIEAREHNEGFFIVDRRGLIAFVFDNTFSISNSKHVQFSFNVEPVGHRQSSPTSSLGLESEQSLRYNPAAPADPDPVSAAAAAAAAAALYPKSNESSQKNSLTSSTMPNLSTAAAASSLAPFPQVQQQPQLQQSSESGAQPSRKLSFSKGKSTESVASSRSRAGRRNTQSSANGNSGSNPGAQLNGHSEDEEDGSVRKLRSRPNTFNSFSSMSDGEVMKSLDGRYVNGFLQKKRRKQFQGFARRYFSLDTQTGLLSYYLNNRSSILRGVMPIKIAELKADQHTLQFTLNSGMEKWTLKANDAKTFSSWCSELKEMRSLGGQDESGSELSEEESALTRKNSLDIAAQSGSGLVNGTAAAERFALPKPGSLEPEVPSLNDLRTKILALPNTQLRRDFQGVYLNIIKDVLNSIEQSSGTKTPTPAPKKSPRQQRPNTRTRLSEATITPLIKRQSNLQKRLKVLYDQIKSKNFLILSCVGLLVGIICGISYSVVVLVTLLCAAGGSLAQFRGAFEEGVANDTNSEGDSFAEAYSGSNVDYGFNNRSSNSLGSSGGSEEDDEADDFSDASDEDDRVSSASVTYVPQNPTFSETSSDKTTSTDSATTTTVGTSDSITDESGTTSGSSDVVTEKLVDEHGKSAETSLYPLPHQLVTRRTSVASPVQPPPSLLAMLKKAKDPSNMTAPITSNEPLSGVESVAEMYENSDLLDAASKAPPKSHLRVSLVALFAVARLSTTRIKERTLRKPFTPLLGETYEMVREDRGFRFIAEKVTHKPEVLATQAESILWTVHFTSRPHTKMWAKSIQLTDVGHFSVTFPDGESISFINPEMFIRNILAGERYIEPNGTVTVESSAGSHLNATIAFKAGGMFSGRSEEVKITCGKIIYEGKWTESLFEGSKQVWSVKPLVEDPNKHYGWSAFVAQLNEITQIEDKLLPPNDSRLRPDLRIYEGQKNIDKSEETKLVLEQHQRERRKELEVAGKQHEPFFFVKSKDSKGHYILRHGDRNYWVLRQKQDWKSIPRYFE